LGTGEKTKRGPGRQEIVGGRPFEKGGEKDQSRDERTVKFSEDDETRMKKRGKREKSLNRGSWGKAGRDEIKKV